MSGVAYIFDVFSLKYAYFCENKQKIQNSWKILEFGVETFRNPTCRNFSDFWLDFNHASHDYHLFGLGVGLGIL